MVDELISTAQQLPQAGTDVSGFLFGISGGIVAWGLGIGILLGTLAIIFIMVDKDIISFEMKGLNKR